MRATRITLAAADSPQIVQVENLSNNVGLAATLSGGGTYTITFTRSPTNDPSITQTFLPISAMAAETADAGVELIAITAIKIAVVTGTVDVDIVCTQAH